MKGLDCYNKELSLGQLYQAIYMKKTCFIVFLLVVSTMNAKVSEIEKKVLLELFKNTHGENWTNSWQLDQPINTWHGVEIKNDHVVGLNLFNNKLIGQLPTSIGKLKYLKILNVAFNQLHGEIPSEITNLQKLEILRLGKNNLTGSIPENIGDMRSLEVLDVYDNKLSGTLPSSIGKLINIRLFVLSNNAIQGEIPNAIGDLIQLKGLELGNNKFDGHLPKSLGQLINLNRLVLSENNLMGDVPEEIFALPELRILQLQNNNLGVDVELKKSVKKSNYALIDMGYKSLRFKNNDIRDFGIDRQTRMADTKFEDVD